MRTSRRIVTLTSLILILLLQSTLLTPAHAQDSQQVVHIVQPGENLYRISLRYGVTMDAIAQANGITDYARIFVGQQLIIPGLSDPSSTSGAVVNPLIAGTPITHTVQPGENLTSIAAQYGVTVEQILQANNIANPNRIDRGTTLQIWTVDSVMREVDTAQDSALTPADAEAAAPPVITNSVTHIVQPGERLSGIAARYGVSWPAIAQANNLANPNQIFAGQQLIIPNPGSTADLGIMAPVITGPGAVVSSGRSLVVDLSDSRIYAYENGVLVHSALASMGLPATPTVQGDFAVYMRYDAQTMSGPGYYLPGVPWVQYFYQGYAIHGTYWHNNFGQPMSHGCVNLPNDEALWFYQFATIGTPVHVQA